MSRNTNEPSGRKAMINSRLTGFSSWYWKACHPASVQGSGEGMILYFILYTMGNVSDGVNQRLQILLGGHV